MEENTGGLMYDGSSVSRKQKFGVGLLRCSYLATLAVCVGCKSFTGEYTVVQSVEALRFKSEGRGFGSRWDRFNWLSPSGRIFEMGSTQPLTEVSTRGISWGVKTAGAWG